MNFHEQNLRRFIDNNTAFKLLEPIYIGRDCFIELSNNRRARIKFVKCDSSSNYNGLSITILDINGGKIDRIDFNFYDYHPWGNVGRSTTNQAHAYLSFSNYGNDYKWNREPTDSEIKSISNDAYNYISLFK